MDFKDTFLQFSYKISILLCFEIVFTQQQKNLQNDKVQEREND